MDPCFESTPIQVKQQPNELGRAFNGHLADHHQFRLRTCSAGSTASTPISPDIDEQIEARLALFKWTTILDTTVLIAEDLGAAPTPLVHAQMECYTRRSAASRHPSRWRGAATNM
jgi:hypothetical protein